MAALTESKEIVEKKSELIAHPVVAAGVIYRGAMVKHNAAGYLAPAAAESGAVFAGIAYEEKDNSAGSAGDVKCLVMKKGSFLLEGAGFSQADVGSKVYASDDQTISTTQGANEQEIGRIEEFVSATQVWVDIKPIV